MLILPQSTEYEAAVDNFLSTDVATDNHRLKSLERRRKFCEKAARENNCSLMIQ